MSKELKIEIKEPKGFYLKCGTCGRKNILMDLTGDLEIRLLYDNAGIDVSSVTFTCECGSKMSISSEPKMDYNKDLPLITKYEDISKVNQQRYVEFKREYSVNDNNEFICGHTDLKLGIPII